MAKHHTFRLNDKCRVLTKRGALGPQQGEEVIIVNRHATMNDYIICYASGLHGWFKAEELELIEHDAWSQLEEWEDAYNARGSLLDEEEEVFIDEDAILREMETKLDRIDNGHCGECDKELNAEEGDDESMCLSCRTQASDEETCKYQVVDPRMRVLFETSDEDEARTYAANTPKLCKIKCVGEEDKWL